MYTLLEELKDCIYKEQIYKDYLKAKYKLENQNIKRLLLKYQDITEQYFSMKKYEKYTDISTIKEEFIKIKNEVSENEIIQNYYQHYYLLNDMLEELTEIIFKDISEDLPFDRYSL